MQQNIIDIGISGDQSHAVVESICEIKNTALAISVLEKTAPKAYAHLQHALASQPAQLVLSMPTHMIRRSQFANRAEASFNNEAFQELKHSIRNSGGNSLPIIVRPVTDSSASSKSITAADEPVYEIVAGHRRYQVCRELGLPVRALVVAAMSDAELIVTMHHENHARQPLTAWEYGAMLKNCLDQGVFKSMRDMSRSIGRDVADLSRALTLVHWPEIILQSFETPLVLQYKDADLINKALAVNSAAVLAAADEIVQSGAKLSRLEVLQKLTSVVLAPAVGSTNTARKVHLRVGKQDLGSIVWDAKGLAVVRVNQVITAQAQDELQELLIKLLARFTTTAPNRESKVAKAVA